jgi:hypothetical protein
MCSGHSFCKLLFGNNVGGTSTCKTWPTGSVRRDVLSGFSRENLVVKLPLCTWGRVYVVYCVPKKRGVYVLCMYFFSKGEYTCIMTCMVRRSDALSSYGAATR